MPHLRHIELGQRFDDLQPGANGSLGLALVRQRVTEEGDDAVTQALKHVAFVARDAHRAGVLVAADDLLQNFGIDPVGQLGEAHHVAEEHGELAALAFGGHGHGERGGRRR